MSSDSQKKKPSSYDKARCARMAAIQACFQSHLTQTSLSLVQKEFQEFRLSSDDYPARPKEALFNDLLETLHPSVEKVIARLEALLSENSKLSRQDPVIKAILMVALTELGDPGLFTTPAPVIISEYVAITAGFFDVKQASFVNRVLDQEARKLGRPLSL